MRHRNGHSQQLHAQGIPDNDADGDDNDDGEDAEDGEDHTQDQSNRNERPMQAALVEKQKHRNDLCCHLVVLLDISLVDFDVCKTSILVHMATISMRCQWISAVT